jgi:glutamyl-tRNA reductase
VSSVAVELSTKIFDRLEGKTALIIGAGKMSLLTIQHLQSKGVRMVLVTNRTFAKAAEVAEQVSGRAVPFDSVVDCLSEADIVISSTGSSGFIIRRDHAHRAMNVRKNRPMFFIDIAVPRDIDPQVNEIDNVFLYDIDDLKAVAEKNRMERLKEAEKAEEIVEREAEMFWGKLKVLDITPTIREIQSRVEEMRRHEIEMTLKKMGALTEDPSEFFQ